jgi:hypothetical protein
MRAYGLLRRLCNRLGPTRYSSSNKTLVRIGVPYLDSSPGLLSLPSTRQRINEAAIVGRWHGGRRSMGRLRSALRCSPRHSKRLCTD